MINNIAPPSTLFRSTTVFIECIGCNNLFQQHYSDLDITSDKQLCIACINNIYAGRIFQKKLLSLNDDNTPKIYFGLESDGSTIYLNSPGDPDLSKNSTINCVKNILKRNNFVFSDFESFGEPLYLYPTSFPKLTSRVFAEYSAAERVIICFGNVIPILQL